MARKQSRSSKKNRRKQPELRTGGGRSAKAERARQREQNHATPTEQQMQLLKLRPNGAGGYILMLLIAYLGVAGVLIGGWLLNRWGIVSYPDSIWLYVGIGMLGVAPSFGGFSRSERDADSWGMQALVLPLGLFVGEWILGPNCPSGVACSSVGARGSLGIAGSILVIVVLAFGAWALARGRQRAMVEKRPAHGRTSSGYLTIAMVTSLVVMGLPLSAAVIGIDLITRSGPKQVALAKSQVASYCYPLGEKPELDVRSAPTGIVARWSAYAVRAANETRPAPNGKKLPSDWAKKSTLHPYEALVAFDGTEVASLNCNLVSRDAGNVTQDDMKPHEPSNNPLDPEILGSEFRPYFYTNGPKEPDPVKPKAKKSSKKS